MAKNAPAPKENPDYQPQKASNTAPLLLGAVAAVLIALVVGGFVWNANKSQPPVDDKVLAENASFIVGDQTAPTTVDVFEDFNCPHCNEMESQSGPALSAAASSGKLRVRYHLLNFMDSKSESGDYSSRAAGAIACVAEHGDAPLFQRLHTELFKMAGSDPSNERIAEVAGQSGAGDEAQMCIREGALVEEAKKMADQSAQQLRNSNDGQVATPTVLLAGEPVDDIMNGDSWVTELITGGPSE